MKDVEVVVIDYYREGNAAVIAHACSLAFSRLGITSTVHVLRPPEAQSPLEVFPPETVFWELDRNHGAQQRYALAGEIQSEWTLYVDNDLVPTDLGVKRLMEAVKIHGDLYSCYGWLGHNISNVRGKHLSSSSQDGMEVDFVLRAYLFQTSHVRDALLDFPIFHWEDDLNMQIKIQKRLKRPSWIVEDGKNFVDMGGHDEIAHYRQGGHFERREKMVSSVQSYLGVNE